MDKVEIEEITKTKFQWYVRQGSIFDQMSWRLRPEHIQANGQMTKEDLEWLCYHFYVYGVSDSFEIKETYQKNISTQSQGGKEE